MNSIKEEFIKYNFDFDKTTQDYRELPYEREIVRIAPNEFVKASVLNQKLFYLHQNFLFLYKLCNVADFKIPKALNYSFSGSNVVFYEENSKAVRYILDNRMLYSKKGALSYYKVVYGGSVLFYVTNNQLVIFNTDKRNADVLTKTSFIDPLSGSIVFRNIDDIKTDREGRLYISDNGYQNLYYYDINPVLNNENIYRSYPFLKNAIGGEGAAEERSKFGNINSFCINKNYVVVEDNINRCFKIFDKNLNWLGTTKFVSLFKEIGKFDSIGLRENNDIFAYSGKDLYVFVFDLNYNITLKEKYNVSSYIRDGEVTTNIRFSYSNENVYYVFTNLSVKKVWATNPLGCIGEYKTGDKIVWGDVFYKNEKEENLIIRTETKDNPETFKFIGFTDSLNVISLLVNDNFNIHDFEDLKIKKDEYVTNWVVQKAFKKVYFNHSELMKEIKFKLFENNDSISILEDKIYNQLFLNFTTKTDEPIGLNVGINENFQAEVFNRIINELLDVQTLLLLYVLNNQKTKGYLSPAPYKKDKNIITYTYYADESINLFPEPAKLQPFDEFAALDGIVLSLGGAPYTNGDGISIIKGVVA
jgi:hypothetical protein